MTIECCTDSLVNCCVETLPDCCISVTVISAGDGGGGGSITLEQFITLMGLYNAALPSYASEEEAAADGLVSGDEFLWSDSTDVGIAGDKHIMS